jgi:hypothetical protein
MVLSDGSEWQFWPGMEPPSPWKVGDKVEKGREGKFSIKFINITRQKEEAGVSTVSPSGAIEKNLDLKVSKEEYPSLDVAIRITKTSGELIWLEDDSKWHMWSDLPRDPGLWEINDRVIVTRRLAKSKESKKYQMKNVNTGKELTAMFLGYER